MPVTDEMICFSLYAASRATTQAYRKLLEPVGITYPQYLVLVILWNDGEQSVSSLGELLQLDSGTLSPLLKRMADAALITRERRRGDERVVVVTLAERGTALRGQLSHIPARIAAGTGLDSQESAAALLRTLQHLTETMQTTAAQAESQGKKD
ncbi:MULTISPECIES: MarR family winged helix-turn-helix transcriptional regulator [unclassified Pseudoclavibacter]|uniref:MarR family winged helix-turn-helix transcriptional regulator n=1 Tax=unclassified Pseudoclavibacter TaxID=2615177 RepID=UPI0012F34AF7|nr:MULTISPECIES: MarR family transcriptional regulator [unclassified Pseudoclavibacter]MBF4458142.1 MarR family transcriptional regulator [Pseudoclavibacter sp. VKM Ac-2867]VXB31246.1 transcriptional regulator sensing organic peroxides [Pseudoclavibacter sp. 8L]